MKIIVTGSLGNISKPLTKALVQKGHSVTAISHKPEKQKEIEALGAKAAIGYIELEDILTEYFNSDDLVEKGLPTVKPIAAALNVSPNYLSGLLKVLTGQSTQQHIHNKLIEKAKEKLSTTDRFWL
jgi:AraC-like DNA-binding protein